MARNPNDNHPIHGASGASRIARRGDVDGNLPLDLMRTYGRGGAGGGNRGGGGGVDQNFLNRLMNAVQRRANFNQIPFIYTTTVIRLRAMEERSYFFIQNTDPAQSLFLAFGTTPSSTTGVVIAANGGFYEPFQVPQNEIYIVGSGTGTGILITASLSVEGYTPTELSSATE